MSISTRAGDLDADHRLRSYRSLFGIRDRVECQLTRPLAAARLLLDAEPDIRFTIGPARSPEK